MNVVQCFRARDSQHCMGKGHAHCSGKGLDIIEARALGICIHNNPTFVPLQFSLSKAHCVLPLKAILSAIRVELVGNVVPSLIIM